MDWREAAKDKLRDVAEAITAEVESVLEEVVPADDLRPAVIELPRTEDIARGA